jgi:membrane AbrB-like protein
MRDAGKLLMTMCVGYAGATLFAAMSAPLPWMLGSLFAGLCAAAMRVPLYIPKRMVRIMGIPIGLMVGSKMTVAMLGGGVVTLILQLFGLVVVLVFAGALGYRVFRRLGYDRATAFFSTVPGGIQEMTLLGEQFKADVRPIAIAHATRIIVVVSLLPFSDVLMQGVGALASFDLVSHTPPAVASGARRLGWVPVAVVALIGVCVGKLLKLRAPFLLGPLLSSAALLLSTGHSAQPSDSVVQIAQLVLGSAIACRFSGRALQGMFRVVLWSAVTTMFALVLAAVVAFFVCMVSHLDPRSLLLAYAPGGLAESTLIAVAIHADVALVALGQLVRIVMVTLLAGLVFERHVR